MKLAFYGGAGTVTGSRFLLQCNRRGLMVDCGLFQGLKELRLLNWGEPAFDPRRVDAIVLTHAHIDHSGYLPRLVKEGFGGPIYCSAATRDLAEVLLPDAAQIQEEDAAYANRKGFSRHQPALPLYTLADAERALALMQAQPLHQPFEAAGFETTLHDAGHILGSSFVEIRATEQGREERIVFSGDLGRFDAPIHPDPDLLPACDTLVVEATYGDRAHPPDPIDDRLAPPIREVLQRGGTVLIPAFAVARAQLVLVILRRMIESGAIPDVPVHLDSPMAIDVTNIYRRHATTARLELERADLAGRWVRYHRSVEESMSLNTLAGPRIIIASSGMMTGGRVLHHLKRLLPDPDNLLILVGYQAPGTRGRKLLDGARFIRMHGRDVPVRAPFIQIEGLSAHADADDIERWALHGEQRPRTVFVVHGEQRALEAMRQRFENRQVHTCAPTLNQSFTSHRKGSWKLDLV